MIDNKQAVDLYLDLLKRTLTASIYEESGWAAANTNPDIFAKPGIIPKVKSALKNFFVRALNKKSLLLVKRKPLNIAEREEGRDWPFIGYSMAGHRRMENVQHCFEQVIKNNIAGDLIETGAWRGGTTIFMRALLKAYGITDRKVWVADSFEGLPRPKNKDDGWDLSDNEYLKISVEQVKSNFRKFDLLDDQVEFLKGWFADSLPDAPIKQIAILRLDGDLYSSTMDALENLYHKVSKGGYIIVDDYVAWPACKKAITDFRANNGIESEIIEVDWSAVYWRKD